MFHSTPTISVEEAYARTQAGEQDTILVDVRTKEEFVAGHPPRAEHIPLEEIPLYQSRLKAYREIFLFCRSGSRSSLATQMLHAQGVTHAKNVEGGLLAWQAQGLPTEEI